MGAKTSSVAQTANGQSSGNEATVQGFSILRSLPGSGVSMLQHPQSVQQQSQSSRVVAGDSRQRARSLSSVPDLSNGEQSTL